MNQLLIMLQAYETLGKSNYKNAIINYICQSMYARLHSCETWFALSRRFLPNQKVWHFFLGGQFHENRSCTSKFLTKQTTLLDIKLFQRANREICNAPCYNLNAHLLFLYKR